jgi:hypothetical protein
MVGAPGTVPGDLFKLWIGGVEQTSDGKLAKGDVAVTS